MSSRYDSNIYLDVSFAEKNKAKHLGAMWNRDKKLWYIYPTMDTSLFSDWIRVYLEVSDEERDDAIGRGARADPKSNRLYIVKSMNPVPFSQWISGPPPSNAANRPLLALFLNTDTSGLPDMSQTGGVLPTYTDLKAYSGCRVVKLAALLCDVRSFNVTDSTSALVRPEPPVPGGVSNTLHHGVTQVQLDATGRPLHAAADELLSLALRADCLVSHNVPFTLAALCSDLYRLSESEDMSQSAVPRQLLECLEVIPAVCTMIYTASLVQARNRVGGLKNPTLQELLDFVAATSTTDSIATGDLIAPEGGVRGADEKLLALYKAVRVLAQSGRFNLEQFIPPPEGQVS